MPGSFGAPAPIFVAGSRKPGHPADASMATWQMLLVRFDATLASKMSAPGYKQELVEVVQRSLLAVSLVPGQTRRGALARLRSQLEEALEALDDLERGGGLSSRERQQLEALRDLRSALEKLE